MQGFLASEEVKDRKKAKNKSVHYIEMSAAAFAGILQKTSLSVPHLPGGVEALEVQLLPSK